LSSTHFTNGATSAPLPGVIRNEKNHVFISARIIGHDEELRFVFEAGAERTAIDRRVAARLGLKATEKSSVGGVGVGRVEVDVVKNASLQFGDVRLDGVDLNLVDDIHESEGTAGIIGYDLLCANVVTLDYKKPGIVVTAPSAYQYHGVGDVLPLSFKGRGVVGPNEWFRIGSTTIPATQSACCAGNDDVNRQLGSAILSHFRITFNYPARQIILKKN